MTRRAVLLGAVLVVALAWLTPYSDLQLKGTWIAACHLPVGAFFGFLMLVAVINPGLKLLRRKWALKPGELAGVYGMMLVGAGIPSFGLAAYLIPTLVGAGYFATPENAWATWFYRFIPQGFVPFDLSRIDGSPVTGLPAMYRYIPPRFHPAGPDILKEFYEGIPAGRAVPWEPWLVPLLFWTALAMLVFSACFGLAVILRRQWVDHERLTFPLVQLPLAMVEDSGDRLWPGFFRQPVMWAGFTIPMLFHLVNGLHTYLPAVPQIPQRFDLTSAFGPPYNQLGIFWLWIHFSVIGLTFLLPPDFSFSLWFFYLVFKIEGALLVHFGQTIAFMPNYPVPRYAGLQMLGAFLVLAAYLLYASRAHLALVREVVRGKQPGEDANEPVSYRTAVAMIAGGLLGAAGLLHASGADFLLALLVVILTLTVILILTRMIAEGGLLFIQAPFRPTDMLLVGLNAGSLGPRNLTSLAFFERVFAFDVRACLWPYLQDGFRLADGPGIPRRKLAGPFILAILLAIVVSYAAVLNTAYRNGAVTQQAWFMIGSPQQPFARLVSNLTQPMDPKPMELGTVGLGGLTMFAMVVARNRLAAFPLHPLGYAMGPSWPMIQLWFSLFLGWLCKAGILKAAGMRGYRQAWPFFLGLVLGEFCAAGMWVIIGVIVGGDTSYRFLLT